MNDCFLVFSNKKKNLFSCAVNKIEGIGMQELLLSFVIHITYM